MLLRPHATLLDVWTYSSSMRSQLLQLCSICFCDTAGGAATAAAAGEAATPLRLVCTEARCSTHPLGGSGTTACCWEALQGLRGMGIGPSSWELGGFPCDGTALMDHMYTGERHRRALSLNSSSLAK